MIKIGDKVSLFHNIGLEGIVIAIEELKQRKWVVGGSASKSWKIRPWESSDSQGGLQDTPRGVQRVILD